MTQVVGIVNLTTDSFSGDGTQNITSKALKKIDDFIRDGAGVIDIGAESTRPGAKLLTPDEEWQKMEPVVEILAQKNLTVGISIDTRHPTTAEKFLRFFSKYAVPALYINDVSGGSDLKMITLAKDYNASLIVMHSLTIPADQSITIAAHENVVEMVYKWAAQNIQKLGEDIIIDPGIGFGKTAEQSLALIKNISRIKSLGARVMVGHSRKSFLSLFSNKQADERDPETLLFSNYLVNNGVDYLRVHDVKSHVTMFKIRANL